MDALHKRILFGSLAAACTAYTGLDATLFRPSEYPLAHLLLGDNWQILRNVSMSLTSVMAAAFGYLALNVKDDGDGHPPKPTS